MFSTKFQPALNKEGYSKLTFVGSEIKQGIKDDREWSIFFLNFEVMGKIRGTTQIVGVPCGFTFDPDNNLGKSLLAMGFKIPEVKTTLDADGFEVEDDKDIADDDFQQVDPPKLDFSKFLESKKSSIYIAKLSKDQKGFWRVDVDTLKSLNNTYK